MLSDVLVFGIVAFRVAHFLRDIEERDGEEGELDNQTGLVFGRLFAH